MPATSGTVIGRAVVVNQSMREVGHGNADAGAHRRAVGPSVARCRSAAILK